MTLPAALADYLGHKRLSSVSSIVVCRSGPVWKEEAMSRSFMSARGWLAFLTLGVIWGAPFLLVKIAVRYVASVDEERHPVGSGPRFMRLSHA